MEQIAIKTLVPGTSLGGPLYNANQKLLLSSGNILTHEMVMSMRRAGMKFAFLGEWSDADYQRINEAKPVAAFRNMAQRMASAFESRMENQLGELSSLDVEPEGQALAANTDHSVQEMRSEQRLKEMNAIHNKGTAFVELIAQGQIADDQVADAASEVVNQITQAFMTDRSLLVNLTNLCDKRDYFYMHALNTTTLAINIAAAMGYGERQVKEIGVAAMVQDLGMVMVPEKLLNAPRKLTPSEFVDIQKHVSMGLYTLNRYRGLPHIARIIAYQNHERINGNGYPKRRGRKGIHRFAQIVSIADVYDAMTSDRPWRKAHHPYHVMEHLIREANQGKYDPEVVRGLLKYLSLFPVGCLVRLSHGEIARVVHSNSQNIARPVVRILFFEDGTRCDFPATLDLLEEKEIGIVSVVEEDMDVDLNEGF